MLCLMLPVIYGGFNTWLVVLNTYLLKDMPALETSIFVMPFFHSIQLSTCQWVTFVSVPQDQLSI